MREIRADGIRFTDLKGRTRIFNGFNFVYKGIEADPDGVIRMAKNELEDAYEKWYGI